jgi:hypothetical protein
MSAATSQYSKHRRRVKSEAVDFVTGSQGQGDGAIGGSACKPYTSRSLLKVEEPLVSKVEQVRTRVRGARPEAGEAEPRALSLYDVQHPASKHTKLPAVPASFSVSDTVVPNYDRTGTKKVDQDVNLNIGGLKDNIMHAAAKTSTKKQSLDDDDDVPLIVLKQHGSKCNGRSTSAIDVMDLKKFASPEIVISSFDNDSVRNEERDRTKEPVRK